ncbi:hypothetical protein Tco_0674689, partial [Tanacetum coccineum]
TSDEVVKLSRHGMERGLESKLEEKKRTIYGIRIFFEWRCFLLDIVLKEMVTYLRSSRALQLFIEQSHDEVHGCLKGGNRNSGEKRLAILVVKEACLSEEKEL